MIDISPRSKNHFKPNVLNILVKRYRFSEWIKKAKLNRMLCCLQKPTLSIQMQIKSKEMEKDVPC